MKTLIVSKISNVLTLILSFFKHTIVKKPKNKLTTFNEISSCFDENKTSEKYKSLMSILQLKLNEKYYKTEKSFFSSLKQNSKKFHAQNMFLLLFESKMPCTFQFHDKTIIETNTIPMFVLQTINNKTKSILIDLPYSIQSEFMKSNEYDKIVSHVDCVIRKLFEHHKCYSYYSAK